MVEHYVFRVNKSTVHDVVTFVFVLVVVSAIFLLGAIAGAIYENNRNTAKVEKVVSGGEKETASTNVHFDGFCEYRSK